MKVTVYSRPGCHLCEVAIDEIAELTRDLREIEIEVIDIEGDEELLRRYLERIPVVEVGGEPVSELVFDAASLCSRLGMARGAEGRVP